MEDRVIINNFYRSILNVVKICFEFHLSKRFFLLFTFSCDFCIKFFEVWFQTLYKKSYSSYSELAEDTNVEVVYVGTLNPQHLEVALMMLEHGKHVLVEKPLCMNEKQARQLITTANLFLMGAIWSRAINMFANKSRMESSVKLYPLKFHLDFLTGVNSDDYILNLLIDILESVWFLIGKRIWV